MSSFCNKVFAKSNLVSCLKIWDIRGEKKKQISNDVNKRREKKMLKT